jgi:hypothetical protein
LLQLLRLLMFLQCLLLTPQLLSCPYHHHHHHLLLLLLLLEPNQQALSICSVSCQLPHLLHLLKHPLQLHMQRPPQPHSLHATLNP